MLLNYQKVLMQEAEHLYFSLFSRKISPFVMKHYLRAHAEISELHNATAGQLRTVQIIVGKHLDATAIEPWLRGGRQRHLLTAKLLLIAYLAECDGQHKEFSRNNRFGWFHLIKVGCLGVLSLGYGRYLKARHGLL